MSLWALIVAAGSGTRMGGPVPKVLLPLGGKPVLAHTLAPFAACLAVDGLCVVTSPALMEPVTALLQAAGKPFLLAEGGETRGASVRRGLDALPEDCDRVLVHDGARPCLAADDLDRLITALSEKGSAVAGWYARNTVHVTDGEGHVVTTPERGLLFEAATPQCFFRRALAEAYARAEETGLSYTDEASLMTAAGQPPVCVEVSPDTLKLTTPEDMVLAEAILSQRSRRMVRIGEGYDVHALKAGRRLVLGGVEIPHEKGLDGHSDADVLTHAVMDALLGAAAMGDIGLLFPPDDDAFLDANSLDLLREVTARVSAAGYRIVNVDATVSAQRPKLMPHRARMAANLAEAMGIPADCVSVKATTTEHLGFEGREEGITARAIALLEK